MNAADNLVLSSGLIMSTVVGCEWFIYRNIELRYWLVPDNVKNNRMN